jgi:hypothetical protein
MQCGPVRFSMSARTMTESTPFEHKVTPRSTEFRMAPELTEATIQDIDAAMVDDASRNEMIANDIVRAIESGRCPLLLTGRTEHLQYFAARLSGVARHVFVLKGGMGKKQRRETGEALAAVPENESRVILATGSYIGEGFDDGVWTLYYWPCRSRGRARCSSMWADCIASMTTSGSCKSTTM